MNNSNKEISVNTILPSKAIYGIYIFIIFIISVILYYTYQYLNVDTRVKHLIPYDKSLKWKQPPNCYYDEKFKEGIVADYFYCASANSLAVGNLKNDYLHLDVVKKNLLAGARFIEFTVMANDLSEFPTPVVAMGKKEGQWQSSLNNIPFEEVCYKVIKFAFQSYQDDKNVEAENIYPLFVYLDIQSDNLNLHKDVANIIRKIWGDRLTDRQYNHQYYDLAHVPICRIFGKIIIITDLEDIADSDLNDISNYNKLTKIHYNEIRTYNVIQELKKQGKPVPSSDDIIKSPKGLDFQKIGIDQHQLGKIMLNVKDYLVEFTRQNLVLVYPNTKEETQLQNHDFWEAVSYGCQFVSFNFQIGDLHFDKYMETFYDSPIRLKNKSLRLARDKVQQAIKVDDDEDLFMEKVLSSFYSDFKNKAVAILPFGSSNEKMVYQPYTFNLKKMRFRINLNTNPGKDTEDKINPNGFTEIDLYMIIKGLNRQPNTISFKSLKYPSRYLVASGKYVQLMATNHSRDFFDNASFYPLPDDSQMLEIETIPYYKFVPYGNREQFIRLVDGILEVDEYNGEPIFGDESRFGLSPVPIEEYYSFQDYKNRYIRIIDGGFMTSNATQISSEAKFKLTKREDDQYVIDASNKKLVKYDGNKRISAIGQDIDDHTKFQVNKEGNLFTITTYHHPKQKTWMSTQTGSLVLEYDKNLLKPAVQDSRGNIVKSAVFAPALGRQKFFRVVRTYGIVKPEID